MALEVFISSTIHHVHVKKKELGERVYIDPVTRRRVRLSIAYLLGILIIGAIWVYLLYEYRGDIVVTPVMLTLLLALVFFQIMWAPSPQFGAVALHRHGISFPLDAIHERSPYVRFNEVAWFYHDAAQPWRGIHVGLTDGEVYVFGERQVDTSGLVSTLSMSAKRVSEDPQTRELLDVFDKRPECYGEMWNLDSIARWNRYAAMSLMIFEVTVVALALPFLPIPIGFKIYAGWLAVAIAFVPILFALTKIGRVLENASRAMRAPSLGLVNAAGQPMFKVLEEFMRRRGSESRLAAETSFPMAMRVYEIPEISAKMHLIRVRRFFGSKAWQLSVSSPTETQEVISLRQELARFCVENGLMDSSSMFLQIIKEIELKSLQKESVS